MGLIPFAKAITCNFRIRVNQRMEYILLFNLTLMQPKAMRYFYFTIYENQGNPTSGKKTLSIGVPTLYFLAASSTKRVLATL
jgi:hypothetical protein